MLTAQQRVKRSGAAVIVASFFWCSNLLSHSEYAEAAPASFLVLVAAAVASFVVRDRYDAELRRFGEIYSQAHFAPRLCLFVMGLLLGLLMAGILVGDLPLRSKVVPLFAAATGFIFVGPWWRLWRYLRFVFWGAIGIPVVLLVVFIAAFVALSALHRLFGETFAPALRWLEYWGENF